ncbi:hypothetical protein Acr_21g0001420 [Actinidia rufa]|uniref:NAD(P)-binding Rossmann-fold superfamily protein n=1 Tax=Actinidia rufa TaxID=165716 RepID=A0A7J0GFF8_9ERIC|nr:hypothetical protein Acr_21g0001420 [Actinidia rufa]
MEPKWVGNPVGTCKAHAENQVESTIDKGRSYQDLGLGLILISLLGTRRSHFGRTSGRRVNIAFDSWWLRRIFTLHPEGLAAHDTKISLGPKIQDTMGSVPQRTVLITGVSRGLGKSLALEMAKRGHTIIGCSRSQDKLNSLQAELSSASSSSSSAQPDSNSSSSERHIFMTVDVVGYFSPYMFHL